MKTFWITDSRFKLIVIILVIMWLIIIGFFIHSAEEISKDPCSICAKRMGESVACTTLDFKPISKVFYPNFTVNKYNYDARTESLLSNVTS